MNNPIEAVVAKVMADLLHREAIRARRLKVLVELQLLAKDDPENAAGDYLPAIAKLQD